MTLFEANFDYESVLFWGLKDKKANHLLEHLFFFCADKGDGLLSSRAYPEDYLNFIKSAIGHIPVIEEKGAAANWWGKLEDLKLERKINSKITSFNIAEQLKINNPSARQISNAEGLLEYLRCHKNILLRHPFERSGRGNIRVLDEGDFEKKKSKIVKLLKDGPVLVEKYFERQWDLGTSFVEEAGEFRIKFQIKNLNDSNGTFRGAVLLEEVLEVEELSKIANAYYEIGAREILQVDSFAHEEGINWLCEVNFRKTMGLVTYKLNRLGRPGNATALLLTPASWIKKFSTHFELCQELEEVEGVFPLSPVDNKIYCWFLTGANREELLEIAKAWWHQVAKNSSEFPDVFMKILPNRKAQVLGTPI